MFELNEIKDAITETLILNYKPLTEDYDKLLLFCNRLLKNFDDRIDKKINDMAKEQ